MMNFRSAPPAMKGRCRPRPPQPSNPSASTAAPPRAHGPAERAKERVVSDLHASNPHDDPGPEEVAALWRVVRGETVPSETIDMLRALRLSALKEILSKVDGEPPPAKPS